jgi:outer membrane protein OmpA-like peptidoglycan-associated protein
MQFSPRVLHIIAFVIFLSIHTNAQNRSSAGSGISQTSNQLKQELVKYKNFSYSKLLRFAKMLEHEGSYVNSVEYYKMAHNKKPTNKCILQKLSELNFKLRDYVAAEDYTRRLLELDKNYDKEADFRLALSMKANTKYKEAIDELEYIKENKRTDENIKKVDNEIAGAKLAMEIRNRPEPKQRVENVQQLNGYLQEYAPQPLKNDNFIYSSLISDTALNVTKLKYEGRDYTSKLLFTRFDKEKNLYLRPEFLPIEINAPEIHIGNSYMVDNKLMYFTSCKEDNRLNMKCRLQMAVKNEGKWKVTDLKKLNEKGTTNTQPALYEDGTNRYLLFVSDRSGGKGGMDIWYSKIDSTGKTGDAVNLAGVNSFGDEVTPYYSKKDKTLFFSSNGYPSIGGFDIFKVTGTVGKWEKVINAKQPLNSSVDDLYLKMDDNDEGYFVSNRSGSKSPRGFTCCDDIWALRKAEYAIWMRGMYVQCGDEMKKPLAGVDALMIDKDGKLVARKYTNADSTFIVKVNPGTTYRINGLKDGYYPSIDSFSTPKELFKNDTIFRIFCMDPIEKKRYIVENVYYAFDKSVVRPEYYSILDSVFSLMKIFPNLFLKIDGHTDSRGTDVYNQSLSERRCKAAAEYLLLKGLPPERIIMRGYSELVPIAPNITPSGEDDPAGRAKNRRVEFKLLAPNGRDPKLDIGYRVNLPFGIE